VLRRVVGVVTPPLEEQAPRDRRGVSPRAGQHPADIGAESARLIAYSREDAATAPGAVRALLTTRTAVLGFYLAVLALFSAPGTSHSVPSGPMARWARSSA
jgi:hypothetical protein